MLLIHYVLRPNYVPQTWQLGEEELESLKSDLITPVKIAAKEALEDMLEDRDEEEQ